MTGLVVDKIQLGQNGTATQNFTFKQGADGTFTLARGNAGATSQDILTVDANGVVSLTQQDQIKSGTAIATTSGTSHDFTGIPSWVKKITFMFSTISTDGASVLQVQLGGAGGIEATGYLGATEATNFTSGFALTASNAAGRTYNGSLTISLLDASTNTWTAHGVSGRSDASLALYLGYSKSLSATLDRIRLTTVNGTDTFDAGKINILYEG